MMSVMLSCLCRCLCRCVQIRRLPLASFLLVAFTVPRLCSVLLITTLLSVRPSFLLLFVITWDSSAIWPWSPVLGPLCSHVSQFFLPFGCRFLHVDLYSFIHAVQLLECLWLPLLGCYLGCLHYPRSPRLEAQICYEEFFFTSPSWLWLASCWFSYITQVSFFHFWFSTTLHLTMQ